MKLCFGQHLPKTNKMNNAEIISKIERYCAYQDRCTQDVLSKLKTLQVEDDVAQEILTDLKADGFVNDERFVQSFIRGKANVKHWGKIKIRLHLFQKGIDKNLIDKYIDTINEESYQDNLQTVIDKWQRSNGKVNSENLPKLYRHLLSKGYGSADVMTAIKKSTQSDQ